VRRAGVVYEALGLVSFSIWVFLRWGRGRFWRMPGIPSGGKMRNTAPSVAAVVPARNEAAGVRAAVGSLAAQRYAGRLHILRGDDASDDDTALLAASAAQTEILTVLRGAPLPAGWTGKMWAMAQGIEEAGRFAPDYLLFTDADIVHPPDGLQSLVAAAESFGYDLVSGMVMLRCESWAERALIPAFVFFFFMLYPPTWVGSSRHRTAAAAGGSILIRRRMLERIGGIARIRGELIDDCALAQAVKDAGGRVCLGISPQTMSIREYESFREIGEMISRTAFTQLRYSGSLLVLTVLAVSLVFFGPVVAALGGSLFGTAAWILMAATYSRALVVYRRSLLWAPLLPGVAGFYLHATIHSAWMYWRGKGGEWKGRTQALS